MMGWMHHTPCLDWCSDSHLNSTLCTVHQLSMQNMHAIRFYPTHKHMGSPTCAAATT
jgi:hypothetical protein